MTIKELATTGAISFSRSINPKIEGIGKIRWTDNLSELQEMLTGLDNPSVAITYNEFANWPTKGLKTELGEKLKEILKEAQLGKKGAVAINEALKLRAAWLDDEYWPNTERGGH